MPIAEYCALRASPVRRPGRREIEVVVDEDGYAELRWWAAPGATPADVAAVITAPLRPSLPLMTATSAQPDQIVLSRCPPALPHRQPPRRMS